ncbi:unnamed protein product [Orchesella dallaii]|uniref:Uncharacterized protein n=1 Tax=Orchesella dallaii TaxID=48710 RepID=A0ABP1RUJ0_9HEXA
MEDKYVTHIRRNLNVLIRQTTCHSLFLTFLQAKGIIGKTDVVLIQNSINENSISHAISAYKYADTYALLVVESSHLPSTILEKLNELKRLNEAQLFGARSFQALLKYLREDNIDVARTQYQLATVKLEQYNYNESGSMMAEVLKKFMAQENNQELQLEIANVKKSIAKSLLFAGKPKEAIPAFSEAYQNRKDFDLSQSKNPQISLDLIAGEINCLLEIGEYEYCLSHWQKHLDIYEGKPGEVEKKIVPFILIQISTVYEKSGDKEKAVEVVMEAYKKAEIWFDTDVNLADVGYEVGRVLANLDKIHEAIEVSTRVFECRLKALGEDNLGTLFSQTQLGDFKRRADLTKEAIPILQDAHNRLSKKVGVDHMMTLETKMDLAMAKSVEGELDEALSMAGEVLASFWRIYGPYSDIVLNAIARIVAILIPMRAYGDALFLNVELERIITEKFGSNDNRLPKLREVIAKLNEQNCYDKLETGNAAELLKNIYLRLRIAFPDFNMFKSEHARFETFSRTREWPKPFIKPDDCAKVGFFYLEYGDHVQCAFCRGVLSNWEEGDDPRKEHEDKFPQCPFICGEDVVATLLLNTILAFPIRLDNDCFINLVGKGIQTESLIPFLKIDDLIIPSYTFTITLEYSNVSTANEESDIVNNITLQESYLRYYPKLRGDCLVFILHTLNFNETVTAIHQSGYGTSDETIFFLQLPIWSEWNSHLESFSALHLHSPYIFHANIVFLGPNSNTSGVHCYVCLPNTLKLYLIKATSFKSFLSLKRFAQQLNGNGHKRHLVLQSAICDLNLDHCLKFKEDSTKQHNKNTFFKHIQAYCSPPMVVLFIATQQTLNVSLVSKAKHVPEDELHDFEWLTQIRYGEMLIQRIPNHIITTRDRFLILRNFRVKVLSCVTAKSISQQFDYVIVTTLDVYTWLALLTVSLVYGVLYGSIFRGLDVMWPLTSQACWLKHSRKSVCLLWVSLIFVTSFYSSSISSESMQLADLPSFSRLLEIGYKLWEPIKQHVSRFASSYEKGLIVNSFRNALGSGSTGERNYLTVDEVSNFFYDGNGSYIHHPDYQNLSKLVHTLTTQAGIPTKFENLQIDVRQNEIRELKMMAVGAFLSPKPIELKSALGVSLLVLYGVGTVLIVVNFHAFALASFKFMILLIRRWINKLFK